MSNIGYLEERLDSIESIVDEYREQLRSSPADFSAKMALKSAMRHRNEVRDKLVAAKETRATEIVEYRLVGEIAERGHLPLGILGKFAKELERQIYAAAYFIRDGKQLKSRIPKDLKKAVNLRLAGLRPGSTRIQVAGDLSPDLFGNSIFEQSLEKTFDLLQATDPEDISNYATEVGTMSAQKLRKVLETVHSNDLEIQISWDAPGSKRLVWEGKKRRLKQITDNLAQLEEGESGEISIAGTVTLLSAQGRIEITTDEDETYRAKYTPKVYDKIQGLTLEDRVQADILELTIKNRATGKTKTQYRIRDIASAR